MDTTEVLIVGAGPVGLSLALECARHKVQFRIVDAVPKPSIHSKALALWSSAQETFSAMGVAGRILEKGLRPGGLRLCTKNRTLLRVPVSAFEDSPFPAPLLLPQSSTEQLLIEHLQELGHRVERPVELTGFEESESGIRGKLCNPDGQEQEINYCYLVGCDGAHSTVRHLSGAKFEGRALPECFLICDAEVHGGQKLPQDICIFLSRSGVMPMFPIRERVWRIISIRASGTGTAPPTLSEMQEHVNERGPAGVTLRNPEWLSSFRISERKVDRFRIGRVLLAGDAAHIHSPAGGQGMNTGIQDAFNLGWKLGCILRHGCKPDPLLQSYHIERSQIASKVIAETSGLTKLALVSHGPLAALRNLGASFLGRSDKAIQSLARTFSGTGLRYSSHPLLGDDGAWHEDWRPHGFPPGQRIRDASVLSDDVPVSLMAEVFSTTKFTLLVFAGRRPNYRDAESVEAMRQKAAGYSSLVGSIAVWRGEYAPDASWLLDPDGSAHARFAAEFPAAYLIRPDGVVAARTQPADFAPLEKCLARHCLRPGDSCFGD